MKRFYFSKRQFVALIIGNLLFYAIFDSLLLLVLSGFVLFLFRKSKVTYRDSFETDEKILLAPINGYIKSIEEFEDKKVITLSVPWYAEPGLYLPCEVIFDETREKKGKPYIVFVSPAPNPEVNEFVRIDLKTKEQSFWLDLKIFTRGIFWKPILWFLPGDRGRAGARYGLLPLGGTVLLSIKPNANILALPGQEILGGQTVLGVIAS